MTGVQTCALPICCVLLNNVTIPASVANLGTYVFKDCAKLANITFEEPAENATPVALNIGAYTFQNCTALTSITLPDRTNTIANFVFSGCGNLTEMNLPFIGNNRTQTAANNANVFGYIFGTTAYEGSVETAQTGTSSVRYQLPASLTTVTIRGGNILSGAFQNCANLTSITLPENLGTQKAIGNNAFAGCTGITAITLPSDATSIGASAFNVCNALTSIIIPETVTVINANVFQNCTALETVTFAGNAVTKIDNFAFAGWTALTEFTITEGVKTLGTNVFDGCGLLASLTVYAKTLAIGNNSFNDCEALAHVYFTNGLEEDFTVTVGATGNDSYTNAEKHYEAPAPEPQPQPQPTE